MSDKFMNTYARTGLVFVRGSGARLYTAEGREYIDFTSGIGVNALGHAHPALVKAISDQAAKALHVSNYFLTDISIALAERLTALTGHERVFFCNSGAETNEALIKIARKLGNSRAKPRNKIITLKGSFHGRTITTVTATGQDKFHQHFGPFTPGFDYAQPEDLADLDRLLDESVCAFLFEPIQGEGGVRPLSRAYLQAAEKMCAERGILFVSDEVQTGVGRTGTFFADQQLGVKPPMHGIAKGIAGGVPCGAVLASGEAAEILQPGDHGTTFGGNPLAAAAAMAVLDVITAPGFMDEVKRKGDRIAAAVESWKSPIVKETRGMGLMRGIGVTVPPGDIVAASRARGLLTLTAGSDTVRLLPPLVITDAEIDEGLAIMKEAFADVARAAAGKA